MRLNRNTGSDDYPIVKSSRKKFEKQMVCVIDRELMEKHSTIQCAELEAMFEATLWEWRAFSIGVDSGIRSNILSLPIKDGIILSPKYHKTIDTQAFDFK